ncbi:MAG: hypothetical protein IJB97_02885, partial [Clostridia bacterium]|nr:hypothetical protein [Clostridia bacterium]
YEVANDDGTYTLGFANKLQAYNFRAELNVPVSAEYSKVSLLLTDATDLSNTLKLSYSISETGAVYYSVNDGLNKPIEAQKGDSFHFRYDALTKTVTFGTKEETVYTALDGRKWSGFAGNEIWLEVLLENVYGANTSVEINGLNNQRFYAAESFETLDMMPEFYQDIADISPVFKIGEKITVPPAWVSDVFAVGAKVTLTAYAPDGSILKATDGLSLEKVSGTQSYEVLLETYGEYIFSYSVVDDLGRINKRGMFQFSVSDTVSPTVEIGAHSNVGKVGGKLKLAELFITDDKSAAEACKYEAYVLLPDYNVVALSAYEKGFVFTMQGNYKIFYYVYDEAGNVTLASYEIFVQ